MFIGLCFVHSELYEDDFIREALETIGDLNNIALDNYCSALIKVRKKCFIGFTRCFLFRSPRRIDCMEVGHCFAQASNFALI